MKWREMRTDWGLKQATQWRNRLCNWSETRVWSSHTNVPPACLPSSAAQQAALYKEEAILARSNLEDSQRKLQNCIFLEKQKADTIQELQRELQKLHKDSLMAEEELTPNRYHRFTSRDALSLVSPSGHCGQLPRNRIADPVRPAHSPPTQIPKLLPFCF